jgi:hypothetical protein
MVLAMQQIVTAPSPSLLLMPPSISCGIPFEERMGHASIIVQNTSTGCIGHIILVSNTVLTPRNESTLSAHLATLASRPWSNFKIFSKTMTMTNCAKSLVACRCICPTYWDWMPISAKSWKNLESLMQSKGMPILWFTVSAAAKNHCKVTNISLIYTQTSRDNQKRSCKEEKKAHERQPTFS